MFRIFTLGLALAIAAVGLGEAADPPAPPPPVAPSLVTLDRTGPLTEIAAELTKQTALPIDLSAVDGTTPVAVKVKGVPAWEAIERAADRANCFVSVAGKKVKFSKRPDGVPAVPSSIDGPFRVVLRKVVAKRDLEFASTEYELHLEVQWEPRFPVFLIDAEPKATATVGDAKISADSPSVRTMPLGYTHPAVVRLKNVPRDAKTIDELTGEFRLVAAAKVLAVEFKDLTGEKPQAQTVEGVSVTLNPVKTSEKRAEFGVELEYPKSHPEFESFQLWSGGNVFRLYPPNAREGVPPADYSAEQRGRRVLADYNFTGPNGTTFALPDLKGWRVVYETPGPMTEQTVKFTLKGVLLP